MKQLIQLQLFHILIYLYLKFTTFYFAVGLLKFIAFFC
jgi:hypothetical protein